MFGTRLKNSVSDHSLYLESDEEDNKHEDGEGAEDGNVSDCSDSSAEIQEQTKAGSYTTSWPQSYRQSMDLYGSVPSPSIGFLGTPSLSRFGSSIFSSSLARRYTPEVLSSITKPLLPTVADEQKEKLLPPKQTRKHSVIKDKKSSTVSHGLPSSRQNTYGQTVLNGINVLCGVGILSTPYAAKEGGWAGISVLFIYGILAYYTGILLRRCMDSAPGLESYPDIGHAAFGTKGRIFISIILYVELYAACVEYIILESDNLSSLFPNAQLSLGGLELNSHHLFAVLATILVLPTVLLRDLTILSYISGCGVIASILVVFCLFWVGLVDDVMVHSKGTTINVATLPVALGLYGYCYSGHAVFPNIYTSMAEPSRFPSVLLTSFGVVTVLYVGAAIMGYTMFGESTESQFTLNLPQDLVVSKIALWTTVVNPFTKYALTIAPVAMSLEELIPSNHFESHVYSILIRIGLVISTLLVGLSIPFFDLVMALIGSFLTMFVTFILPSACFLSIERRKVTRPQVAMCILIIIVGAVSSVIGSYSAISKIVENLSS